MLGITLLSLVALASVATGAVVHSHDQQALTSMLHKRDLNSDYDKIVNGQDILKNLDRELVLYAYCSEVTEGNQCWGYLKKARDSFWGVLRTSAKNDTKFYALNYMVGTGDEDQLRKLLADGTIFCRMSDYNVLLQGTTHSKPRTPQNSVWRSMIQDKMDNVKPFMEMLMKRGLHQQKLQTPGNFIGPYYKESVSNSCYDVSFREGHDLMLKWAIANRNEAATQMLVEMAPPRGRLHNLYVGALYLGYLCDYGKFQQLSTSVDCAKASQNIRAICSQIWLNANQPQQGEKPPKQNLTLPEPYYSAKFRDQPADVLKEFLNYDRRQISNFEFLEAL